MEDFQSLGLHDYLLQSLKVMQFCKPTDIQAKAIPLALKGHDILGSAQTGTGKTAAYGIPLVSHLIKNPSKSALVLTPTRELAVQVIGNLTKLIGRQLNYKSALLIGGDSMVKQLSQLKNKPRLVVGTPGRINDHLMRSSLNLSAYSFVVCDEMDRMFDQNFEPQLQEIANYLPAERQTMLFSATLSTEVLKVAESYSNNAIRISVGSTTTPVDRVKQEIIKISEAEKWGVLVDQLSKISTSSLIFVKTKIGAEKLAVELRKNDQNAVALHGGLHQGKRERVIMDFRKGKYKILVATDVAARGLDISHIGYVINYDLPQCPEDYIHRIGRTGRAGRTGVAINLLTPQDNIKWRNICKLINPNEKLTEDKTQVRKPRGRKSDNFAGYNSNWGKRSGEKKGGKSFGASTSRASKDNSFVQKDNKFASKENKFKFKVARDKSFRGKSTARV